MLYPLPNRKARRGFTLTEMLVVVAIIVVLAAVAVPITMNVLTDAKIDLAKSNMRGPVRTAIFDYCRKHALEQGYPTVSTQLAGPPNGIGILTIDLVVDPWGNPYQIFYQVEDPDQPVFTITSGGPGGSQPIVVHSTQ
jgi:prepilin-type N-terminal cleavage/methylation domain-containing protein